MLLERNISIELLVFTKNSELFKAELENPNGSPIAIAASESRLNKKTIHILQKSAEYRDIICCNRHERGIAIYAREDFDVKLVMQKATTVSEFINIKLKRNNGPPFLYQPYTPMGRIRVQFKTELEYLTDPLLWIRSLTC